MKGYAVVASAAMMAVAGTAQAATIVVAPGAMQGWTTPASESANGSIGITGTQPRSGNGSLELTGDRSRAVLGTLYPSVLSPTIAALSNVVSLTFDWQVATGSTSNYNALYTPALRLIISNGKDPKKEMIWEGVYNNTYNTTSQGIWYTSGANDKFYIGAGNENSGKSVASWAADTSLAGWNVVGISVGHGSGAGLGYHAFADNVTLTTTSGATTYNFERTAPAAVPEPGTWALMILGFGIVGYAMRRRTVRYNGRRLV
jgi:hypothetical protein